MAKGFLFPNRARHRDFKARWHFIQGIDITGDGERDHEGQIWIENPAWDNLDDEKMQYYVKPEFGFGDVQVLDQKPDNFPLPETP